jgi:hypothetical protein
MEAPPSDAADCVAAGDDFLARGQALVLQAHSVVAPQEVNALINPRHAQMAQVRTVGDQAFVFDPRLFAPGR